MIHGPSNVKLTGEFLNICVCVEMNTVRLYEELVEQREESIICVYVQNSIL